MAMRIYARTCIMQAHTDRETHSHIYIQSSKQICCKIYGEIYYETQYIIESLCMGCARLNVRTLYSMCLCGECDKILVSYTNIHIYTNILSVAGCCWIIDFGNVSNHHLVVQDPIIIWIMYTYYIKYYNVPCWISNDFGCFLYAWVVRVGEFAVGFRPSRSVFYSTIFRKFSDTTRKTRKFLISS